MFTGSDMKHSNLKLLLPVVLLFPALSYSAEKQEFFLQDTVKYISPFEKENERCFICHSLKKYEYSDKASGKTFKGTMNAYGILVRNGFYTSNHKSFSCTDCHSSQFQNFPHPEELKNEPQFNCLDCHGGDAAYMVFKFEAIDAEFRKSVHFRLEEKEFSCWQCHDPHSYRLTVRYSTNLREAVKYDNAICLDCHADYERFNKFSDRDKIKLSKVHKWLPHQSTHFKSVRCIDCHAKTSENLLVPHYVMPEEAALRNCKKCHTENAEAMTSLLMTKMNDKGNRNLDNEVIMSGLSIIGPNRNKNLNDLILALFAAVLAVIGIHILLRVIRK